MQFIGEKFRHLWRRIRDFCVFKVLHADDPPHRLALGIAVGMFVTFMPAIGLQMLLSVFIAWLLRANKLVGVPLVWLSNPVTIVPIYYPCYLLGCKLMGTAAVRDDWAKLEKSWQAIQADSTATWWNKVEFGWQSILDVLWPLSIGCVVVGLTAAILSYYVSLFAIRSYRIRRWGQLMPPGLSPKHVTEELEDGFPTPEQDPKNAA